MSELLKDKRLLVATGLFLLILLILIAGGLFGLKTLNQRLVAISFVLLLWMLYYIIERFREARLASGLEQSLKAQADEQLLGVRPEKKAEIEQLQQQLTLAIESLKKSKLSKGRKGRAALYALPWYLIIGPPAVGKTTAIENSGLDFPFGKKIKGVGGTRNCDWFFSTSAVFLDTAGRYMTEEEDKDEWIAFLDVLKKYRRRMPLNGVIVGISISDLLNFTLDEIETHALGMRRRIDELITRLGIRFPVYLVFTKCDLLQGFVEFFQELSRREREQLWGCTFSRDMQDYSDHRALFEREFKILYKSLVNLRMKGIGGTQSRQKRRNLYVFPLQFASARENLSHFIGKLFQPNPYQESPIFRGFYFTSGTQEGLPIDKVIQSIANKFNLPETAAVQEEVVEKKSYFIKSLFTKIIIPDQSMGTHTSRAARSRRLARLGIAAATFLVTLIFITGVFSAFLRSKDDLNTLKARAADFSKQDPRRDVLAYFQAMDAYRKTIIKVATPSSSLNWKMRRGDEVFLPSLRLFITKIHPFINRYFFHKLENKLRTNLMHSEFQRSRMYDYLKAYLLVGSHIDKLDSLGDKNFLSSRINLFFDEYLIDLIPNKNESVDKLKPLINRNVDFFVNCLAKKYVSPYDIDLSLVERVRRYVKNPPTLKIIYNSVITGAADLESFSLQKALGRGYQDIIHSNFEIPGVFTKPGWNLIEDRIKRESQNLGRKDWVMGDIDTQIPPELRDKDYVSKKLQNMYFDEYADKWWDFLKSIKYRSFANLSNAVENLKILGDTRDSPLIQIFEHVSQQTRFENQLLSNVGQKAGGLFDKAKSKLGLSDKEDMPEQIPKQKAHIVDRQFSGIHSWISSSDETGSRSELSNTLREYDTVSALLEGMIGDPGPMSKEYAARVFKQPAVSELYSALTSIKRSLRTLDPSAEQAVRSFFEQPILISWEVILINTQRHLNTLWRKQVYDEFQYTLGRYYPFTKNGNDAAINDLDRFFQPQNGIFWKFYSDHLEPFIRKDTWRVNLWENRGIKVSKGARNAFDKATNVTQGLYRGGGLALEFSLEPVLPVVHGGDSPYQICLNIDGNEDCYQMGHRRVSRYSWPGYEGQQGARLSIDTRHGSYEHTNVKGTWGWFKLLERAKKIQRMSTSEYVIHWEYLTGPYHVDVIYKLKTQSTYNPFSDIRNFFSFECPSSLN